MKLEENTTYNGQEGHEIEGRDGLFVEKYSIIDKYTRRKVGNSKVLEKLCAAHFFKC